jgi:hypothetical protein
MTLRRSQGETPPPKELRQRRRYTKTREKGAGSLGAQRLSPSSRHRSRICRRRSWTFGCLEPLAVRRDSSLSCRGRRSGAACSGVVHVTGWRATMSPPHSKASESCGLSSLAGVQRGCHRAALIHAPLLQRGPARLGLLAVPALTLSPKDVLIARRKGNRPSGLQALERELRIEWRRNSGSNSRLSAPSEARRRPDTSEVK